MDSSREEIRAKLVAKFSEKLDEMLKTPAVTMSDIENVVTRLQKEIGSEAAEGLLALKKTVKRG